MRNEKVLIALGWLQGGFFVRQVNERCQRYCRYACKRRSSATAPAPSQTPMARAVAPSSSGRLERRWLIPPPDKTSNRKGIAGIAWRHRGIEGVGSLGGQLQSLRLILAYRLCNDPAVSGGMVGKPDHLAAARRWNMRFLLDRPPHRIAAIIRCHVRWRRNAHAAPQLVTPPSNSLRPDANGSYSRNLNRRPLTTRRSW